jgi:nucleoside triphosphate diphosphatase
MNQDNAFQVARKVQQEASLLGFDWPDVDGVLDKVEEETEEVREALSLGDMEHARRELGDLLLVSVHLANHLDADPARELSEATKRFSQRFANLRREVDRQGKEIKSYSLDGLEAIWQSVKNHGDQGLGEGG